MYCDKERKSQTKIMPKHPRKQHVHEYLGTKCLQNHSFEKPTLENNLGPA